MTREPLLQAASLAGTATWRPTLGAIPSTDGTSFCVWAPAAQRVELIVEAPQGTRRDVPLRRDADGFFTALLSDVPPGTLYQYRLGGQGSFPDPVSRYQPEGVHGRSEVIDPAAFWWTDAAWTGITLEEAVIYELHVGTFTPAGTFAAAVERLPYLKELGVTAIELMPVAEFPGQRNWGYDGASLFAPSRTYGRPDDLRRLVDEAHGLGLAVLLDVVYNHLGPDGNYLGVYSPYYFTDRHHTPWGSALNFDGESSRHVRDFFVENALYWIHEYHLDGLRLDATHSILDDSPTHIVAELAERARSSVSSRQVLIIAEDHRNLNCMITPRNERPGRVAGVRSAMPGDALADEPSDAPATVASHPPAAQQGWGLDGVWADCFHHQMRRLLAGDTEGYFADYRGTAEDLATTLRQGWHYTGQFSQHLQEPRGTDPTGIPPSRFVICLQNHDQVGNRALGERLHHQIDPAMWRAASALFLLVPHTPLLFMGQEWAASTPFLFFTDHHSELGQQVTAGRREEFAYFAAFSEPAARQQIPDPQSASTFLASKLLWDEQQHESHATVARLYRELLWLRRTEPALSWSDGSSFEVAAVGDDAVLLVRMKRGAPSIAVVAQLRSAAVVDLAAKAPLANGSLAKWQVVLTTEDPVFAIDPDPPQVELDSAAPRIAFRRAGAVVLRSA
jgi:maltooligosyltrehalose trehalohydrolase